MQVTVTSILTVCFLNSILAAFLCVLSKNNFIMRKIGPGCMIVLMCMLVIRMFLPVEFAFTYDIGIEDALTVPMRLLTAVIITKPVTIRIWHILMLTWAVGIICNMASRLYAYHDVVRYISLCPREDWADISRERQFDVSRYKGLESVRVVFSKRFSSPFLIGLRQPYFVLPDLPYEREQFHYIILHEWMHVVHKDVLWKILVELLCTAFWWNPIFRYLKKELFQLIEMRNDMQIISERTERERIAYIECLTDTAVQLTGWDVAFGVTFCKKNLHALARRIELIAGSEKFSAKRQIAAGAMVSLLLLMSFLIVFEPYSTDAPEGIVITDENGFLIKNGEQYDVYWKDKYIFTTDDLSAFPDMEIYNNLQEVKENE